MFGHSWCNLLMIYDLHSWRGHGWKSLANRITSDQKSLFTVTHTLFFVSSCMQQTCEIPYQIKLKCSICTNVKAIISQLFDWSISLVITIWRMWIISPFIMAVSIDESCVSLFTLSICFTWHSRECGKPVSLYKGSSCWNALSWGGVTKPISSVPLFSEFISIVKRHLSYWISRSYLTGVAAAQEQCSCRLNTIQSTGGFRYTAVEYNPMLHTERTMAFLL